MKQSFKPGKLEAYMHISIFIVLFFSLFFFFFFGNSELQCNNKKETAIDGKCTDRMNDLFKLVILFTIINLFYGLGPSFKYVYGDP